MADPVPPPSDLPAPYTSPWGRLRQALRAVVASLRLKLRELWRRNGEGDLSVPGFWPQGLAPLFWPLLLTALLALVLALVLTLAGRARQGLSHQGAGPRSVPATPPMATPTPSPPAAAPPPSPVPAPALPAPVAIAPVAEPEPPPAVEIDPLLALLAEADPEHLIASAHPEPAEGLLQMTMAPRYADLPPASRGRWAERWLARARGLGYERLELLDGRKRLLARSALVGSGMILLDPGPSG